MFLSPIFTLPMLCILLLTSTRSFATVNFGTSMGSSVMKVPPIVTNSDNEYTFRKNSISLYAQKSMLRETLIFTGRTELVNIVRDDLVVNGMTIPQQKNQGVRSLELSVSQYMRMIGGWRYHWQLGYNVKGIQSEDSQLKFAIPSDEMGGGLMLIKAKKPRGIITPILNGMMNITDVTLKKVEILGYTGKNYKFLEANAMMIQPISKNISIKIFGKLRRYTIDKDSALFINEEKIMGGLIFKNPKSHSLEFNLYKDFISQEIGSSVGINYFVKDNPNGIERKMLRHYEGKYVKKKTNKSTDERRREVEEMVNDLLEERGF